MTQPSRTTETINRDNAAIREIMLKVKELTVPDRATLAVGIIGNLATMMNRSQMSKLLSELEEEAVRVQDVPPARQRDHEARVSSAARDDRARADGESTGGGNGMRADSADAPVGQAGRGEFRSGKLL